MQGLVHCWANVGMSTMMYVTNDAMWQRTLKNLRTLKFFFQSALGPNQQTLKKKFNVR